MNSYLQIAIIGVLLILFMYQANKWLLPRLQELHFEMRMKVGEQQKEYNLKKAREDLHSKKEKKASDDTQDK